MTPFRHLHHVCVVVHDLDRAVAHYESMGIGPWRDYPPLTEYSTLEHPDPEAFHGLRYKVVDLDNVQLQLCQPPERDCAQRRFLDAHGEGVYHLGFEADLDDAERSADALGLAVTAKGRRDNGSGFVYFDTKDRAGVVLLARHTVNPPL